jgi:ribosomal protein S18 acetylase RimI-like enzyme
MMRIENADAPEFLETVRGLFREYGALPDVEMPEQELAGLPGKYAPPAGRLLVAFEDVAIPAGCVALHKLEENICEMKRLYVRPALRGKKAGRALVMAVIACAREIGYARMRLDTRPSMPAAIQLYRSLGFREIPPYLPKPVPGAMFFELEL